MVFIICFSLFVTVCYITTLKDRFALNGGDFLPSGFPKESETFSMLPGGKADYDEGSMV